MPDLRERTVVGVRAGSVEFGAVGKTFGSKTHTLTVPEIPSHTHVQVLGGTLTTVQPSAGGAIVGQSNGTNTAATGGDGAHNNVQPSIALTGLVKV